ncbi:hypothetical protein SAMN04487944_109144 [Gracilibacillus ureilyticus]|uniref:Uncharacterized protein n=1 Tax=Gracilibacillus ureilyticus TaxID=531814 RepID=A0A1H9RSX8_9BACI|nr:hypothetical protein [Gracilibacillus ureilyticus]SER75806.1 hypothetical protein SAMN04487944_109144 [Gracilibacillus ureilyticus]
MEGNLKYALTAMVYIISGFLIFIGLLALLMNDWNIFLWSVLPGITAGGLGLVFTYRPEKPSEKPQELLDVLIDEQGEL